ncbi:MAG TPA: single-stranded-DNA-specific exonuclease RecJ [Bryobacteraceae bacterium]|nr:single-stranded-DNA-specific exonuclease RecJ [Bryobacteraceae bacterium]
MPEASDDTARLLAEKLKIERLVAAILATRGFTDAAAASDFLYPKLNELHDPFLMRGMAEAVPRVRTAIARREPMLLYGDYDADGTCSIIVLKKTIELLGGLADFYIPHRLKDGYGMRSEVISQAAASGVRLVISVDTGIRAAEVVRHANGLGIDVIVTDHHLPEEELPPAFAVLNPNQPGCLYPNKHLCGAGVTFKLVQALLESGEMPETRRTALLDSFLKPVAIATVADIVPLSGENRVIVKRGLSGLRNIRNFGLKALLTVAGFDDGEIPSAHQVAFRLAPRINAAGRMATANSVIELFLTEDAGRARQLAEQLDQLNSERQKTESDIVESVLQSCEEIPVPADRAALVFRGENWHLGVLGIVASRLVERFCRPVFVLSNAAIMGDDDQLLLAGSGRSLPAFHLLEALESMPDLFRKFGGHRQAAGLTLSAANFDEFCQRLHTFAAGRLSLSDFRPQFQIDAIATLAELTERAAAQVLSLGPFGFGNPNPVLCCLRVRVAGTPRPFSSGKHFTIPLEQNGRTLFCKAWNLAERVAAFVPDALFDVLLQIEDDPVSRKRGYGSWCITLKDFRSSSPDLTIS